MSESGHPNMDPQVLLLDNSSDTESELDLNVQDSNHVHHTDKQNEDYDITQSTMATQQMQHSSLFIRLMSNYMLPDGVGFRSLENVAQQIRHYKKYTGLCWTIERSTMGKYDQYGCRIHTNCLFHVLWDECGSVVITMKNKNLIHSRIEESATTKDGRKRKKRQEGQVDELFNLVSSTHDNEPKPSDLKK